MGFSHNVPIYEQGLCVSCRQAAKECFHDTFYCSFIGNFVDEDGKPVDLQKEPEYTTLDTTMNLPLKELKDTVVHVPTKAEYDLLMHIYEAAGWKRGDRGYRTGGGNDSFLSRNFEGVYSFVDVEDEPFFRANQDPDIKLKTIITLKEFLDRQGLEILVLNILGEAAIAYKGKVFHSLTKKGQPEIFKLMVRMVEEDKEEKSGTEEITGLHNITVRVNTKQELKEISKACDNNEIIYDYYGIQSPVGEWLDSIMYQFDPHGFFLYIKNGAIEGFNTQNCTRGERFNKEDTVMSASEFCDLISPNGNKPFWRKMGFGQYDTEEEMQKARMKELSQKSYIHDDRMTTIQTADGVCIGKPFTSLPKFPMGEFTCAGPRPTKPLLQKVRDSNLNPETRVLKKQGFLDDCGNWTEAAYAVAAELICEEKRKELIEKAKELEKLDKEEKKDCC